MSCILRHNSGLSPAERFAPGLRSPPRRWLRRQEDRGAYDALRIPIIVVDAGTSDLAELARVWLVNEAGRTDENELEMRLNLLIALSIHKHLYCYSS